MFQREHWLDCLPETGTGTVYVDIFALVVSKAGKSAPHHYEERDLLELWAGTP